MTAMPNDELSIREIKRLAEDIRYRIEEFGIDERVACTPANRREAAIIDIVFMCVYRLLEEADSLSFDLKASRRDIPWDQIRGMRDGLAHERSHIDRKIVWDAIENGLPVIEGLADDRLGSTPSLEELERECTDGDAELSAGRRPRDRER